jgi:hypothetical protein
VQHLHAATTGGLRSGKQGRMHRWASIPYTEHLPVFYKINPSVYTTGAYAQMGVNS